MTPREPAVPDEVVPRCITEYERWEVEDWTCRAMGCGEEVKPGEEYRIVRTRTRWEEHPDEAAFERVVRVSWVAHARCWRQSGGRWTRQEWAETA